MPRKRKNRGRARAKSNMNAPITVEQKNTAELTEETSIESYNSADDNSSQEYIPQELAHACNRNFIVGYVQLFEPHTPCSRVINDDNLCSLSERSIENGFSFVCYPLAGSARSTQYAISDFLLSKDGKTKPINDLPPVHVNLSDVQLAKVKWHVNTYVSPWIDCDHPNVEFANYCTEQLDSCVGFDCELVARYCRFRLILLDNCFITFQYLIAFQELPNAEYLGMRTVVIEIRRRNNPNLIRVLRKWLWQRETQLCFWIIYPSTKLNIDGAKEDDDIWTLWANFREQLCNYSRDKLIVGIRFSNQVDNEFIDLDFCKRWRGEPLDVFWFNIEILDSFDEYNEYNIPEMPPKYMNFFSSNLFSYDQRILISNTHYDCKMIKDCKTLLRTVRMMMGRILKSSDIGLSNHLEDLGISFNDQFQIPLRPAEDDLSYAVYQTFQRHAHKYELYGRAIYDAVMDLFDWGVCTSSKPPTIFVVGAGRGGLIEQILEAEKQLNEIRQLSEPKKWSILAIEKNLYAALSLENSNRQRFNNRIRIIKGDARNVAMLQALIKSKADLVVSEMLGSFGCNEAEPEVLEFIETMFCHEKTIMIPESYTSYIEPIHSLRMLQSVKSRQPTYYERFYRQKQRDPNSGVISPTSKFYVVPLNHFYRFKFKNFKKCFTFSHPNKEQEFTKHAKMDFEIDVTCDVTGFAGYFEAILYKNFEFSTIPGSLKSDASFSWFPIYIPVHKPIRCPAGGVLHFEILRLRDDFGIWYEWKERVTLGTMTTFESDLRNKDGVYDFIRFAQPLSPEKLDEDLFEIINRKINIVL